MNNEILESKNQDLVVQKINQVILLEEKLLKLKEIEQQIKDEKENLRQAMIKSDLKKWETPNGTKVTLIEDGEDEEIEIKKIDYGKFNAENQDLIKRKEELEKKIEKAQEPYTTIINEVKSGRKGCVRITLPKAA